MSETERSESKESQVIESLRDGSIKKELLSVRNKLDYLGHGPLLMMEQSDEIAMAVDEIDALLSDLEWISNLS